MSFEIVPIPVEQLNPATYNPRKKLRPGDKEYQDIKLSIERFGFVQNLVWNKRTQNLVAGHQRLTVGVREFGWKTAPCKVVDLDTENEKKLNLALNRVGEGNWSQQKLSELLSDIAKQGEGFDLTTLGFTETELEQLIVQPQPKHKADPDKAVDPPKAKNARTKPGDLYHIISADGFPEHRLICGNTHHAETWEKLLGDARPGMVFTDPPYGVSYQSQSKSGKMSRKDIQNDQLTANVLQDFLKSAFDQAHAYTADHAALYCFFAIKEHIAFRQALKASLWNPKQEIIWAKQLTLGGHDYHLAHEPCFYGHKKDQAGRWYGDRCQTSLWQDDRPDFRSMKKEELVALLDQIADASTIWDEKRDNPSSYIHPTQKPVSLARRAMRHSTLPRDSVVDPFGGSGSTMIAGQLQQRATFTIELEPAFCDAIVSRYVQTFDECILYRNSEEIDPSTFR